MINKKKSEEATAKFVSPAYIQHNPLIADGSVALGKFFGQVTLLPPFWRRRLMLQVGMIVGSTRPNRFADTPAKRSLDGAAARIISSSKRLICGNTSCRSSMSRHRRPILAVSLLSPKRRLGVNTGTSLTALSLRSPNTITVLRRLERTLSTARPSSGNASPSLLLATVALARPERLETLRGVAIELQMAPIKQEVNIGMEPYLGIVQKGAALNDYEYLVQSRKAMFDHLVWWGVALKTAREAEGAKSA